ncbi:MAG: sensor histidine kinase [Verrucomicrobiaceae bacterium]|nr:sensor histidine kinase [Verrucomicrobiaceae bacterium]
MLFRLLVLIIALHPWCVIAQDRLASIAAIRALPPEAADQSIPASIEAVVTFINPGRLLVHDGQDGLYVEAKSGLPPGVRFGSRVKLEGVTASGGFSPILQAHAIQMQGTNAAPAPLQVDGANFLAPTMDCQWVELNAVITGTRTAGHRQLLVAEMGGWPFIINFPDDVPVQPHLAGLLQKEVSIRGTIGTVFNSQRQLTGRYLFVPGPEHISVRPKGTSAASKPPLRAAHELLRSDAGTRELVRVRGIVTAVVNDGFYLRDETEGLFVRGLLLPTLQPGSKVECSGVGALAPFRPVLLASEVKVSQQRPAPEPHVLDPKEKQVVRHHANLVTVEAELLSQRVDENQAPVLQCRAGKWVFEARFADPAPSTVTLPSSADLVQLTGICECTTTDPLPADHRVDAFHIIMRGAADFRLLKTAPWWTLQRLLYVIAALASLALISSIWITQLRRRVTAQAATIAREVERTAINEERQRIARELHDTIEQDLSGLAIQLSTARQRIQRTPDQADHSLALAQQMLGRCRDETRTSIRDLRSIALDQHGLSGALKDILQPIVEESGACFVLDVTGDAPEPTGLVAMQLLRISQEAVHNAIRHGKATTVQVRLRCQSKDITLEIDDNGCGFDTTQNVPRGHFGLLGIQERANKLQAALKITSHLGKGTHIQVIVPT